MDPDTQRPNVHDAQSPKHDTPSQRGTPGRRPWANLVEEQIKAAQERGEFDHLPGSGKPLELDVNPWAGGRALAYSLLKANHLVPPEIERGRDIDAERARAEQLVADLRRTRDDLTARRLPPFPSERRAFNVLRAKTEARYADLLQSANSKALALNISAPSALHRPLLDVEARLRIFREEFPPLAE